MSERKTYREELLALLPHVEKPSRYLPPIRNHHATDPAAADVSWALAFPDAAEVGYPHHGLEVLYHVLNRDERFAAERAFFPWTDMESEMRSAGVPLCTNETVTPLRDLDVIGITLQYELCSTNVLGVIDLAGLELRAADRADPFPLIGAGGPCATNPEPLAPFIDFFLIGEGEEAVVQISEVIGRWKREGDGKKESLLLAIAEVEGIYVPALYEVRYNSDGTLAGVDGPPVHRAIIGDLSAYPPPERPVVPALVPVHDRVYAEIARGCGVGCRFCQAGFIYRPLRERPAAEVVERARTALAATGHDNVTLASLSSGDHAEILPILRSMNAGSRGDQIGLSLPSLRACTLSDDLIREVRQYRASSFTIAPEAGSERMLRLINKGITRDHVRDLTARAVRQGWRLLKLYFLIGLPGEEDEDVDGIASLSNDVWRIGREIAGNAFRVNVAVSNLIPKPHTPFQWEAQDSIAETERKQRRIRTQLVHRNIAHKSHDARQSSVEGLISRGDRRVADVIEAVYRDGARFDEWKEIFSYDRWLRACDDAGISLDESLRERGDDEILPWEHIDSGITRKFLLRERDRARVERATPFCREECRVCRSCDDATHVIREKEVSTEGTVPAASEVAKPPDGKFRYRFRFTKTGPSRFLSQLELVRVFRLALRRAALPIGYSQGFSPRVKISFGRPAPTGYSGLEEVMDIVFHEPVAPREIEERLGRELPEGISISGGRAVALHGPSVDSMSMAMVWRVTITPQMDRVAVASRAEELASAGEILVEERRKGKVRRVDIRRGLESLSLSDSAEGITIRTTEEAGIRRILNFLFHDDERMVRSLEVCRESLRITAQEVPAVESEANVL